MNRQNTTCPPGHARPIFRLISFVVFFLVATALAQGQTVPPSGTTSRTLPMDINQLMASLAAAPLESSNLKGVLLNLPMPDGSTEAFRAKESPMMAPDFQAAFPLIKTYSVISTADPAMQGRLTVTPNGFFAAILTHHGMMIIRPLDLNNPLMHESTYDEEGAEGFECGQLSEGVSSPGPEKNTLTNGATRRTYDLAIVTTGEFYDANGATVPAATAVVTATMSAIQVIYDKELAVRFNLLTPFIYTNFNTDPFDPGVSTNRTALAAMAVNMNFASGTYDVGHVFHDQDQAPAVFSGGGVAGLGVVCSNNNFLASLGGFDKAAGWSGSFSNSGNGWIRLAGHEFGHMFDMPHTFNGTGSSCTSNISSTTSYEIASGTTIMSYNGICSAAQNIPGGGVADNYFNANSLQRAITFITGHTCDTEVSTTNTPPVINANSCGGSHTIPKSTPFRLTATGSDADGDQIYYCWEQYDEDGVGVPTQGFIGAAAAGSSIAPLFRSYPPSTSPTRYFPTQQLVAANSYASDFEPLPSVARTLNFRLFGRDFNTNGGGTHCQALAVTVSGSGPFTVTAPNGGGTLAAGAATTVTWDVSGTNAFCTNVNIKLSIDGGLTFPYALLSSTPNDGSQSVTLPAGVVNTAAARMMVECADNTCVVFYDISDGNFTVTSPCVAGSSNICPTTPVSLPMGNGGLSLGETNHFGGVVTQNTFVINAGSPTGPLANATVSGGTTCQTPWGNEKYATLDVFVNTTGSYTITNTSGGQIIFSVFTATGYNPAAPCSSTFLGSNATGAISWGSSATVTLNACTAYKIVVWTLSGANASPVLTMSGAGTIYTSGASPGASYSYTYVAVNTGNNQIAAVSATSNFTALAAGIYNVYGASYYSGPGPSPATVNPATWVGQTMGQILSGGSCVLFSSNFRPMTITGAGGCTPPVITTVTVTQPTCTVLTGTIVVVATGGGTLEYSKDNGSNWQASATFSNVAVGSYDIKVRLQADPSCMATYGQNPVVIAAAAAPVVNAPTVTQPACLVTTGTIVVNATGTGILEYSINNGGAWQTGSTFAGLNPDSYIIKVRLQSDPTCMTAYAQNPVVINVGVSSPCLCNAYCTPSQTTGTCGGGDEFISLVTFNTINNSSNCAQSLPAGYTNYTGVSTSINTSTSYTLNVTNGGPFTGDQCRAWFDWNADGDFIDVGEEFTLTGSGTNNAQNWTASILVPAGATPGSTRMRVRVTFTGTIAPCGAVQYGEAEDYCLTIIAAGCTPPVVTSATVTQPTCAVPTGTIVVNATGGGTLEYSKDNGSNWQTSNTFSGQAPGNYTIKVRLQSDPSCMTTYGQNPVIINAVPSNPAITEVSVTQPTCAVPTGTIVVNATGAGTLEYSKDDGSTWQTSNTFSGLAPGSYNAKVRLQSSPTCTLSYVNNPIIINAVPSVPVVNAPTVTQPTCAVLTGTIVVNATGGGTLEYSVDNGTNWQTSNTFSSLAAGSYTIKVRLQASPTCMTAYAQNPVVLVAATGCCTPPVVDAPTVTQPTCAVPTGTIVVNATGAGTLEYSVDNGGSWQVSNTFSGLAVGSYTIKVRLQASPTCMTAYAQNPVVLVAASGCCTPPVVSPPTVTQPTCAVPTGTIVVNATGGGTLEYSVDNGGSWQTSSTFPGLAVGSYTITVRLQADPNCVAAYGQNPVVLTAAAGCYCTAGATSTSFEKISNILFNTINNPSTSTAGYEDFTAISTSVVQGATHNFTGTISNGYAEDEFIVWIDFNQDGDFGDAGEEVFNSPIGVGPHSGNITIPGTATLGNTRMRVRLHDTTIGPNTTPCGTSTYGQVEDYTINITASAPCVPTLAVNSNPIANGTYTAQNIITSTGTVPNGGNVVFGAFTSTELQANFEVVLGGVFEIMLTGCTQ